MTTIERLKTAGARIDGLSWDSSGRLIFIATRRGGPWSDEQKAEICRLLGRPEAQQSACD